MRIREPRERGTAFLLLWAALFGGIPLVMMVSILRGGPIAVGGLGFVALFPLIAAVVVGVAARRWTRSGFELTTEGIRGAHDAESMLLPWDQVERIEWRHAGPTSSVRVNGRPLASGPALFAVLDTGQPVRLMQRTAPRYEQQQRIAAALEEAVAAGLVPVEVRPELPRRQQPGEGEWSSELPWDEDGAVPHTTWSSAGTASAPPALHDSPLDDDPSPPPPPPAPPPPRPPDAGAGDGAGDDDPPPSWPTRG